MGTIEPDLRLLLPTTALGTVDMKRPVGCGRIPQACMDTDVLLSAGKWCSPTFGCMNRRSVLYPGGRNLIIFAEILDVSGPII
jgi:hypothetical protein